MTRKKNPQNQPNIKHISSFDLANNARSMLNKRACRLWIAGGDALSPRVAAFMQRPRILSARQLNFVTKLALQRWRRVQLVDRQQETWRLARTGASISHAMCGVLRVQSAVTPAVIQTLCALWRPHGAVTRALTIAAANGVALTPECVDALQALFGPAACETVSCTPAELALRYVSVYGTGNGTGNGAENVAVDVRALVNAWEAACTSAELLELRAFDAWMAGKPRFGAVVDVANVGFGAVSSPAAAYPTPTLFVLSKASVRRQDRAYVYILRDDGVNDDVVWLYAALRHGTPDVEVHTMDRCRDHVHRINVHAAAQAIFPASGDTLQRWLEHHAVPRRREISAAAGAGAANVICERGTRAPVIVLPCVGVGGIGIGIGRRTWCVVRAHTHDALNSTAGIPAGS
jgi:hypothetical protein